MSDPRNTAHDKKVKHDKDHHRPEHVGTDSAPVDELANEDGPTELEQSITVLSKLKEMEFRSRANIETLAELMLTIEDELKHKEFSECIEAVYAAQDAFHTKLTVLIAGYAEKCENLKPTV